MPRFTLLVVPDGRAILTTPDRLSDAAVDAALAAFVEWRDGRAPALLIHECDVVQVTDLQLDLVEPAAAAH